MSRITRSSKKKVNYLLEEEEDDFVVVKSKKASTKKGRLKRKDEEEEYKPASEEEDEKVEDFVVSEHSSVDLQSQPEGKSRKKKQNRRRGESVSDEGSVIADTPRRGQSKKKKGQSSQSKPSKSEGLSKPVMPKKPDDEDDLDYEMPVQAVQGEDFFEQAYEDLPEFIKPENVLDMEMRRPDDPEYDRSTLHIPLSEYQKFPPFFKQYWNAKKYLYDKIVLARLGRWLHVFYEDALILGKMFNNKVKYWGKDRPYIYIYDSWYPLYMRLLVEKGYQVAVVEQTEKGELNENKDQITKRQIVEKFSAATFTDFEMPYDPRYLMMLIEDTPHYGVAMVDVTTNQFYLDQLKDPDSLRSLIYRTKPIELVTIAARIKDETLKMIKTVCNPVIFATNKDYNPIPFIFQQLKREFMEPQPKQPPKSSKKGRAKSRQQSDDSSPHEEIFIPDGKIEAEVQMDIDINKGIYGDNDENEAESEESVKLTLSKDYPELLKEFEKQFNYEKKIYLEEEKIKDDEYLDETFFSYFYSCQALYMLVHYLRTLLQSDTVYRRGTFTLLDTSFVRRNHLHLDAQALESLEVFQVNLATKLQEKGSLFEYLNHCGSPFGKRMLKRWISEPLTSRIEERQGMVADLVEHISVAEEFVKKSRGFPDFERGITRIFNSISSLRMKTTMVGEQFGQRRLKEFAALIKNLESAAEAVNVLRSCQKRFKSAELKELINEKFPDISGAVKQLNECLKFEDGKPCPAKGVSTDYDNSLAQVESCEEKLQAELEYWKKQLKCPAVSFFHGRQRYQLEVPDQYVEGSKKPVDLTITSKKKGFQRFQSEKIEGLLFDLKVAEDALSRSLTPFLKDYFLLFYSFKQQWFQLLSSLAHLDCLCALALASFAMTPSCIPRITHANDFELIQALHPCLQKSMPDVNWVPNDLIFDSKTDIMLLTGPNMSGKSTLLRLAGICTILAQIGCFVPAKSMTLTPRDRIFCRLGASDRLMENKSTFFIEMEETHQILDNSTDKSLVIMDELGRGTSTYDGVAIASAVLRQLSTKIKPKTLFATHYHILLDEFALYRNIENCVMSHKVVGNRVEFYYRLEEGSAERSFATNIARLAGIEESVVRRSAEIEKRITKEEEKLKTNRSIIQEFNGYLRRVMES